MTQTSIATSADYADALLVARRGKHLLFLLLLLMLLGQIASSSSWRVHDGHHLWRRRLLRGRVGDGGGGGDDDADRHRADALGRRAQLLQRADDLLRMILPILYGDGPAAHPEHHAGRAIARAARTTSAFLWCLLLILLLFPFQMFFGGSN